MGKKKKPKNRIPSSQKESPLKGASEIICEDYFQKKIAFNFKDLDTQQGQDFNDWNDENILIRALDTLKSLSTLSVHEARKDSHRFKIYGDFPPDSSFRYPKGLSKDAQWSRIHITGRVCIIGHMVENVFYFVFLDKFHDFCPSSKKHT